MTHCISIKNVYTKDTINCNIKVSDDIKFIYDMFKYQPENILFIYKFDNNKKYITAYNSKEFMIESINNDSELDIIEHICDVDFDNKDVKIQKIMNNIDKFMIRNQIDIDVDKSKLNKFINEIDVNPLWIANVDRVYNARDDYTNKLKYKIVEEPINQKGGVLIWLMEKYLFPKLPSTIQTILSGILEIIDAILIIGISIPGLQFAAGAGIIIDIISFVYCFLRFDVIGMIASLIAFIPIIGNIIGGVMRIGAKSFKYYGKFKDYKKTKRNVQLKKKKVLDQQEDNQQKDTQDESQQEDNQQVEQNNDNDTE